MNNKITITATDGRVFTGTINNYANLVSELNAYEANLKLKKQQEDDERKAKEEKMKKLAQYRETRLLKEINEVLHKAEVLINNYERETGNKLIYEVNYHTCNISAKETKNPMDYVVEEILKAICYR